PLPAIRGIVHTPEIVLEVTQRVGENLSRVRLFTILRGQANSALMLAKFGEHLENIAAPALACPAEIVCPTPLRVVIHRAGCFVEVFDGMREIENRRELAKVTLLNRPVVRQSIAHEGFLGGMIEAPCVGFHLHHAPEGMALLQRTQAGAEEALGTPVAFDAFLDGTAG